MAVSHTEDGLMAIASVWQIFPLLASKWLVIDTARMIHIPNIARRDRRPGLGGKKRAIGNVHVEFIHP